MKYFVKETFVTNRRYLEGTTIDLNEDELEELKASGQARRLLTAEGKQIQTQKEYEVIKKQTAKEPEKIDIEACEKELESLIEAKNACLKKIVDCEKKLENPDLNKDQKEKLETAIKENAKEVATLEGKIKKLSKQLKG